MTYDQAQSPRLGQRTPPESVYVRMLTGVELPEVAYHGQLVFNIDMGILQIYNDQVGTLEQHGWQSVAGGVAGQITFVGPAPPPVSNAVGDIWFDTTEGDDTVDPPIPPGNHHQYRAASAGANEVATGEWESVQSEQIAQNEQQGQSNSLLIAQLQVQQAELDTLIEQVNDVAIRATNDTTFSDVPPDDDLNVVGFNLGSIWWVRDPDTGIIAAMYELYDSGWKERQFDSSGAVSSVLSYDIIGTLDGGTQLAENTVDASKLTTSRIQIVEPIAAGDLLSLTVDGFGNLACRRACAAAGSNYPAYGFSLENISAGAPLIRTQGIYYLPNITPGVKWLSTIPGKIADTPPSGTGVLVQQVGWMSFTDTFCFQPRSAIRVV